MISSELLGLLLNKYVLGSLGAIITLIYAYIKGKNAAEQADEADRLFKEAALQSRIRAAEAKNQFLQKKGEQQNETINSSDTIDQLISMWDKIPTGQGQSPDADKNPK